MEVSSEGGIRYRVKICPMRVIRGYPGQGRIQGFDSSVKRLLGRVTAEPIRRRRTHDVLGHRLQEQDRQGDLLHTLII